ncbi:MAG: J domain-containing protein [Desulfuromonadaceae bacterium]|nr:J domain-containing protein [Desulfuromonadaceae bacterium]
MEQTCYQILAVPPGASFAEIRRAFRRQARRCHPDTAALGMADEDRFQELLAAYRLLSSSSKRACYDVRLANARSISSNPLARRLRTFFPFRWHWLKTSFSLRSSDPDVHLPPVRYRHTPGKVPSREQFSGLTFGQVLETRRQAKSSCYMLCEDGIIRQKNVLDERARARPSPPRQPSLTVALRSWWGVMFVPMAGCWEVFRR